MEIALRKDSSLGAAEQGGPRGALLPQPGHRRGNQPTVDYPDSEANRRTLGVSNQPRRVHKPSSLLHNNT